LPAEAVIAALPEAPATAKALPIVIGISSKLLYLLDLVAFSVFFLLNAVPVFSLKKDYSSSMFQQKKTLAVKHLINIDHTGLVPNPVKYH
jgi:hypothetical protein